MYLPEGNGRSQESDSFDLLGSLHRTWDACRAHRFAVAATVLITLGLVQVYLSLWPPVYEAQVMIVADSPKDQMRSNFYEVWNVFRRDEINTEAQLIASRKVLTRVVQELNLSYSDVYHPFLSHATYLWSESWVGNKYRAVKRFFFPRKKSAFDPTPEQIELGRTLKDMKDGVKVEPLGGEESNVGTVTVRGPSPRVAEIANKVMDVHLEERNKRFVIEAQRANDALAAEVEKAAELVREADLKRRLYYEQNEMFLEFEMDKHEVAKTAELDAKIRDAGAEIKGLQEKQAKLRQQLKTEAPEMVGQRVTQLNVLKEKMRSARFDLQIQLASVSQRYRPDAPEVRDLEQRIKQLDDQIAAQPETVEASNVTTPNPVREQIRQSDMDLTAELPRIEAGLAVRKQILGGYSTHVGKIPEKATVAIAMMREARRLESNYNLLTERLAMARVSLATVASAPASMRVADYAIPPSEPVWPSERLFRVGAIAVGLLGGVTVAMLLDVLQGRVTRTRLLQTRYGLPVYGTLELTPATPARALLGPVAKADGAPDHASRSARERSED